MVICHFLLLIKAGSADPFFRVCGFWMARIDDHMPMIRKKAPGRKYKAVIGHLSFFIAAQRCHSRERGNPVRQVVFEKHGSSVIFYCCIEPVLSNSQSKIANGQ